MKPAYPVGSGCLGVHSGRYTGEFGKRPKRPFEMGVRNAWGSRMSARFDAFSSAGQLRIALVVLCLVCVDKSLAQSPQVPQSYGPYPAMVPPEVPVPEQSSGAVAAPVQQVFADGVPETASGVASEDYYAGGTTFVYTEEVAPVELPEEEVGKLLDESCQIIDGERVCTPLSYGALMAESYSVYKSAETIVSYMPGDGDQFGWFSLESGTSIPRKQSSGLDANFNLHLLSGPEQVALPPRLYDFELGYQTRARLASWFSYDLGLTTGIYSDFEDSARDGVRFPCHAVAMFHRSEELDFVVGVDYLDRDDIKLLPVIGFSWHSLSYPNMRFDLVFPRPRVDVLLQNDTRLYWTARLGGGTWDIEMPDQSNDVFTYRDYQVLMGIEQIHSDKGTRGWEFGFVFSRHIEFRSRPDEVNLDEAFVIRHVTRF